MIATIAFVALLSTASAFMAPAGKSAMRALSMSEERSKALPFDKRPAALDGTLPGDAGFDPAGFTNSPPRQWLIGGETRSLKWYREAEIVHGRVAQLAVLGNFVPAWVHFPGNPAYNVPENAYAELNPYKALSSVPEGALWQIAIAIFFIEQYRIKNIIQGDKQPGDLGLGQTGFWNPFNFNYTEEEYFEKQVQELKHGRLAMFGAVGILLQTAISGKSITEQLAGAFTYPEYLEVLNGPGALGDYFPQGL